MVARYDVPNQIETNGESRLQLEVARMISKRGAGSGTIFDVGANLGEWSKSMIAAFRTTDPAAGYRIHAFEPFQETNLLLKSKLSDEIKTGSVNILQIALSDVSGTAVMMGTAGSGTSALSSGEGADVGRDSVHVCTQTVRDYCTDNRIETIDFLKCDTEGHDFRVIQGALPLLKGGHIGVLQFEYNHRWIFFRNYLKDVFDLAEGLPYCLCKITPGFLLAYESWHPELERFFEGNYCLVRKDLSQCFTLRKAMLDGSSAIV